MTSPLRCAGCGVNPVAYTGRRFCYECVPRKRKSRPRPCDRCGVNPIAYTGRRFCYGCVPRKRNGPLLCKRCGSDTDYFTSGLCRRCHRAGPWSDSCLDCLAWGVTRRGKWLCQACHGWRCRYDTPRECRSCRRRVIVNHRGYCRLCSRHATVVRPRHIHETVDVNAAGREGQQLFFVDMILKKRNARPATAPLVARRPTWPAGYPVPYRQLVLFDWPRDLSLLRFTDLPTPPLPDLAAVLDQALEDHAGRHGWKKGLRDQTRRGIRVLLAAQGTPGAPIKVSEATDLLRWPGVTVQPVLEVLAASGMLDDDREAPLDGWFAAQTAGLPEAMVAELRQWFRALRDGTTTPPRMRPRNTGTVHIKVRPAVLAARAWASEGHTSLREVTRQDVLDVLPASALKRKKMLEGLRSLFRFLKARRMVFANPTARMRSELIPLNPALPMDLHKVRDALHSDNPVRAALTALVAFHAPRVAQVRNLQLTDVRDGRMFLPGNTVVLATPVRDRLAAWLEERARRWPRTANPHLFVNHYTAVRTCPVSGAWITRTIGVRAQAIREDRILNEALATHGDVRRLGDLFGLTAGGATRYAHTTDQPGTAEAFGPRTQGPR